MNPSQGTVTQLLEVTPGCYELTFRPREVFRAIPGQFLQVAVTDGHDPLLRRPLSIFDLPERGKQCKLLFKVAGRGTELLGKFRAGDLLDYVGPLGNGFTIYPDDQRELLVAGGIGVAPLHYLARTLARSGSRAVFLLGAETKKQLLALSSLKSLKIKLLVATGDGSTGFKGTVGELLVTYLQQNSAPARIYCCGPRPMIDQVIDIASLHRIPVQASHEERMACGIGACMGCAFHHPENNTGPEDYHYYRQLCLDGPVISYDHHR